VKDSDQLPEILQRWQPTPSPQPRFGEDVSARAARESHPSRGNILPFRVLLPLAAAIAIMIGSVSGLNFSRSQHQSAMADAYARSIDPMQLTSMDHLH